MNEVGRRGTFMLFPSTGIRDTNSSIVLGSTPQLSSRHVARTARNRGAEFYRGNALSNKAKVYQDHFRPQLNKGFTTTTPQPHRNRILLIRGWIWAGVF